MKRAALVISMFLAVAAHAADIRVPHVSGEPVLLNGRIDANEWNGATVVNYDAQHRLLLKHDDTFLYLGLKSDPRHSGVDLYVIDDANAQSLFHVSSARGRRTWNGNAWSEYEWQSASWAASVIETISQDGKMKVFPPDVLEFQLAKENFRGRRLRIRFELKRPNAFLPSNPADWLQLVLDGNDDEAAVIAVMHAACRAYQDGDIVRMTELLTPDFTLTDADGVVTTREDDLLIAKNKTIVYRIFQNRDMKPRLHGDSAVVTGITKVAGTAGTTQFESEFQFTDTVVRENGKWRVASSHISRIKR